MPEPERPADPLVGTIVAGKYRVTGLIARGGMGRVYSAEQIPLGRQVALKFLLPGASGEAGDPITERRFLQEAATYARLTHPNTVTVFDYGSMPLDGQESYYIALEYVQGRTLARALREDGAFAPVRAVRVAREIARSLREAHQLGIVHRDLKPGNVMLVERDTGESVKVLDFGVAKIAQESGATITQQGSFVGTPRYSSPEQIRQEAIDGRSDIYALGVLLYEMLAGTPPFTGEAMRALFAHLHEPPPTIHQKSGRDVPPEIEAVVMRCLAKSPDERWPDVVALMEALAIALPALGPVEETAEVSHAGRRAMAPDRDESQASLAEVEIEDPTVAPGGSVAVRLVVISAVVTMLAVVAVGGLGAVLWWRSRSPPEVPAPVIVHEEPAPPPPLPPDPPAPAPTFELRSDPPGATVWLDGKTLGATPLTLPYDPDVAPPVYQLKLDGYKPAAHSQPDLPPDGVATVVLVEKPRPPKPNDLRRER